MAEAREGIYLVFVQFREAEGAVQVGSVRAPNPELALDQAKEVYTRRDRCYRLFVVPAEHIYSTPPHLADLFTAGAEKDYRTPAYFTAKFRRAGGEPVADPSKDVDPPVGG